MNRLVRSLIVAALPLLPVGCSVSQEGGVPGTADSFKIKTRESVSIPQGDKAQFDVALNRSKAFKHDVAFEAQVEGGSKLRATIDPKTVKMSDKSSATITIEAPEGAPAGETHRVTVTARPLGEGSSAPATVDIKVQVTEK